MVEGDAMTNEQLVALIQARENTTGNMLQKSNSPFVMRRPWVQVPFPAHRKSPRISRGSFTHNLQISESIILQNFICLVGIVADTQDGIFSGAFDDGVIEFFGGSGIVGSVEIFLAVDAVLKQLFHGFGI